MRADFIRIWMGGIDEAAEVEADVLESVLEANGKRMVRAARAAALSNCKQHTKSKIQKHQKREKGNTYKGENLSGFFLDGMRQLVVVETYMAKINLQLILL